MRHRRVFRMRLHVPLKDTHRGEGCYHPIRLLPSVTPDACVPTIAVSGIGEAAVTTEADGQLRLTRPGSQQSGVIHLESLISMTPDPIAIYIHNTVLRVSGGFPREGVAG